LPETGKACQLVSRDTSKRSESGPRLLLFIDTVLVEQAMDAFVDVQATPPKLRPRSTRRIS